MRPFEDRGLYTCKEAAKLLGRCEDSLRTIISGHPWVWHRDRQRRYLKGDVLNRLARGETIEDVRMYLEQDKTRQSERKQAV